MRLGFLDIINNTKFFIPKIKGRTDLGDDLKVMIKISKEWETKNEHNIGEAGALFRLLQFVSWKFKLNKTFIKERTLKDRQICNNPEIVNWPIKRLLELDNNTPQWASAAILTGNIEPTPDDYFLNLSKEALENYNKRKCELRLDDTISNQANAFIEILKKNKTNFKPRQQDDYCFSRAFNIINKEEGEKRWPELKGHESNRLEEMEIQLNNLKNNKPITSNDHRVVQAISMLALKLKKEIKILNPKSVSKSWPQFWKFLEFIDA